MTDRIYPQFATHNAHSVAAVLEMAGNNTDGFEFQRLHGMGEALHEATRKEHGTQCRIYAPVGAHEDLLAYLVRRLLENGANSSFVHQIVDLDVPPEDIARDPLAQAEATAFVPNPAIPMPSGIFAPRENSKGFDITDPVTLVEIAEGRAPFAAPTSGRPAPRAPPAMSRTPPTLTRLWAPSPKPTPTWPRPPSPPPSPRNPPGTGWAPNTAPTSSERPPISTRPMPMRFFALTAREAGKTLSDGVAELREAVDFLRYYADEAEKHPEPGRGVIVCISPWNFPLAIFTGQIAAALAAGNAVIAKPAEQTPLIAQRAADWLHEAGVPRDVFTSFPATGSRLARLSPPIPASRGSASPARPRSPSFIDRQLAKTAPGAMLIAETGGLNAMIVDSTALLEQATRDIIRAAFQSAGQRCSALRVLYVQKDVEKKLLEMLGGAMDALVTGDPWQIATDVAPVIDAEAQSGIAAYLDEKRKAGKIVKELPVPGTGRFVPPAIVRVSGIEEVEREIFGPVLHLATFDGEDIQKVVNTVNSKGYGLTFGLHTRIDRRVQRVLDRIHVGNVYVNRDQIGAIVGSQPFGGHGLSGTGPKAGGPHYLPRFLAPRPATAPIPSGGAIDADQAATALSALDGSDWRAAPDRIAALRAALRGRAPRAMSAAAGLDFGPVDLPGPTGEANQFELGPRGTVLCLGPDADTALDQAVQALAAGEPGSGGCARGKDGAAASGQGRPAGGRARRRPRPRGAGDARHRPGGRGHRRTRPLSQRPRRADRSHRHPGFAGDRPGGLLQRTDDLHRYDGGGWQCLAACRGGWIRRSEPGERGIIDLEKFWGEPAGRGARPLPALMCQHVWRGRFLDQGRLARNLQCALAACRFTLGRRCDMLRIPLVAGCRRRHLIGNAEAMQDIRLGLCCEHRSPVASNSDVLVYGV